jgi:hypothetical protein
MSDTIKLGSELQHVSLLLFSSSSTREGQLHVAGAEKTSTAQVMGSNLVSWQD